MNRLEIIDYIKENNCLDVSKDSSTDTIPNVAQLIEDGLLVSKGHIGSGYFEIKPTENFKERF
jgi:hypothetical protein